MPKSGEYHSGEARRRMSDAHRGHPSPALGHRHSAETRLQMRRSLREHHRIAEIEEQVIALHGSGMPARDIAQEVGRSAALVRRLLREHGLEPIHKPSGRRKGH